MLTLGSDKVGKVKNDLELSTTDVLEILGGLGILSIGSAGRYKGDNSIHTNKGLPGRDKVARMIYDEVSGYIIED